MSMQRVCRCAPCLVALAVILVSGAGCSKEAKAKRLLAGAEVDYQAQRYDSAEIKYRGVLRLSYLNPTAIRRLGLIYFAEGRTAQARPFLGKTLQLDPSDVEVQVKLAQTLVTLGDAKDAYGMTSRVIDKEPTNEDALLLLADLARSETNLNLARQRIEKLRAAGPDVAGFHTALAWIDLRLQKTNDAEADVKEALKLDPKDPAAYLAEGMLAALRKDMQAASNGLRTAADLSPLRSSLRLKYADFLFESGSTAEAERTLDDLTRQAPDYVSGWINLMNVYYAAGDYERCAKVITQILARDSINYDALMESASLAMTRHDGTNAISIYRVIDSAHTNNPDVKTRMAMAYLLNGERANAVASLNEALSLDHNFTPAILLLAELDLRSGNNVGAINLLAPLVKSAPGEAKSHLLLATAYLAQRQPEQALGVYREMARVFPNNPEVPRLIGSVYAQQGKATQARAAFEQALELSPDYVPALEMITALDVSAKHYEAAEKRLAAVIDRNPKLAAPWLLRGKVYAAAGQTNQAETAMSKAIELDPELPAAYLSLATLYLNSHQDQQALDRLNALLSKTNNAAALLEIGEIHQQAHQYDKARDAYEKLVAIEPKSALALNNLAYLYSEKFQDLDKAAQLAERARAARPQDPFSADTLAWIYFKRGQYQRALGLLQDSLEKQPNSPEVQMHLGMTYYMMEEEDLARVHLQQAVSTDTEYPEKAEARQCLALLAIDPAKATAADIEALEKRLRDKPQDPLPLNLLAAIDERRGQVEKAVEAYQKLIAQNPQDWKPMLKLARLYSGSLHQTRKALDLAKTAHDLAPNDARATAMLGELVYDSGDYPWALSLLQESAPKLAGQPTVQYDLALACYAAGRVTQADAAMEKAVKAGAALPTLEQAKQFQAFSAAAKDPAASGISSAQVQAALAKDPHYLPALALSGLLSERRGDTAQAITTCQQILSQYPQFAPAMRQLTFIYAQQSGDLAKAFDMGQKARAYLPDDFELARTLGIVAYKTGEYQRSLQLLRDNSSKFPNDGELMYYLGMDYYQLKKRDESRKTLQRALALNVPAALAGEANRVLSELK
jgi:tetratricopeptide (TPR) repeat protein